MHEADLIDLTTKAREIRLSILRAIHAVQTGHPGSSLSMIEILTLLYFRILRYNPKDPEWDGRDYFLLSKGHGSPALYATLAHAGFFELSELATLRRFGTRLHGHPKAGALPGVDASTGSLGQGLSVAVGLALGHRKRGLGNKVHCLLGDGELQEGQNWEAMMAGAAWKLGNLTAIVDRNGLQNDDETERIIPLGDLVAKAEAFGWRCRSVDGHSFEALDEGFRFALSDPERPCLLVANTVKGKGVSYMENVVKWHHHPISADELALAVSELEQGT
jgi:transketolase